MNKLLMLPVGGDKHDLFCWFQTFISHINNWNENYYEMNNWKESSMEFWNPSFFEIFWDFISNKTWHLIGRSVKLPHIASLDWPVIW